jgi:hypothetical protein
MPRHTPRLASDMTSPQPFFSIFSHATSHPYPLFIYLKKLYERIHLRFAHIKAAGRARGGDCGATARPGRKRANRTDARAPIGMRRWKCAQARLGQHNETGGEGWGEATERRVCASSGSRVDSTMRSTWQQVGGEQLYVQ